MEILAVPSALALVLTILSPMAVDALVKSKWTTRTKNIIAVAVSLAIAVGYVWATGGLAALFVGGAFSVVLAELGSVLAIVYGLQQAVFGLVFADTGLHNTLRERIGVVDKSETDANGSGFGTPKLGD